MDYLVVGAMVVLAMVALLWQDSRIVRLEMHFCHHAEVLGEYYTECKP